MDDKFSGCLVAIIALFCLFFIYKCSEDIYNKNSELHDQDGDGFRVAVVDSCEYVYRIDGYKGFMAHKGNCKFCEQRNKKLIKSIIDK